MSQNFDLVLIVILYDTKHEQIKKKCMSKCLYCTKSNLSPNSEFGDNLPSAKPSSTLDTNLEAFD